MTSPGFPGCGVEIPVNLVQAGAYFRQNNIHAEATVAIGEANGLKLLGFGIEILASLGHQWMQFLATIEAMEWLLCGFSRIKLGRPIAFKVDCIDQKQNLSWIDLVDNLRNLAVCILAHPTINAANGIRTVEV